MRMHWIWFGVVGMVLNALACSPDDTESNTIANDTDTDSGSDEDTAGDTGVDSDAYMNGAYVENSGAACDATAGAKGGDSFLPNPFEMNSGKIVSSFDDWRCRRAEIKAEIEEYEIGPKPEPPTVEANFDGALNVTVTTNAGSLTLTSDVTIPSGNGPHCVVIGMNSGTGSLASDLFSECIQVAFMHDQVVTNDHLSSTQWKTDGFYAVYPELFGEIGNYSAWSWGVSRLIDGLELVQPALNVDLTRIAVSGCSYAGKMALWAGALDERIALTIAQESGGGGINSWRLSKAFTDRTGISIEKIDNTNYAWFKPSMQFLNPLVLPHDHHELVAMIAPRAFLALGNPPWEWLGDESGYKSVMAAREVWVAMGLEDRIGYDFTGGHEHCQAATGQEDSVAAFVARFLYNEEADTNIQIEPVQSEFDLDYAAAINWDTPEI